MAQSLQSTNVTQTYVKQQCPAVADKPARRETMPKIPPVRSSNKFQSRRKSGVYSN